MCRFKAICLISATSLMMLSNGEVREENLHSQAKISRDQAEKIALSRTEQGKIKDGELQREDGELIWSFDIATPGTRNITAIQVSALDGRVISITNETPEAQKKDALLR